MDRRLAGLLVLVLALVVVAVVPSFLGRRIVGTAIGVTFPGPPQVGQCLASDFPAAAVEPGLPPEIPSTAMSFETCGGIVGGEIVGVWDSVIDATSGSPDPMGGPCYHAAAGFAGLESSRRSTDLPGAAKGGPVRWTPTIGFDPFFVVPDPVERSAGRKWVACLAVPTWRTNYQGTLRAAFTTGNLPSEYGSCWAAADLDEFPIPLRCDQPHPAELLATGWVRDRADAPSTVIEESCSEIAGRIMRTDDPTRGGELLIVADRLTVGVISRPDAPLTIGCFVTSSGPQQLSATLVGLADSPLPLAG